MLPRMTRPRLPLAWRFIAAIAVALARGLMRWRITVEGLHHVPRHGGAVLAFNHHSYFDFVMAAWAVVLDLRRPVRFLAKREVWQSPARILVDLAGAVPVDRGSTGSRQAAYASAVAALRSGELVAVAPEQTISASFRLLPFRTGAVRMAQQAGVPIVPAIGWGSQRFATKGHLPRFAWRLPVTVRYGEPFVVGPDDDPVEATRELQQRMEALLDEVQRDYPDRPSPGDDWWAPPELGGSAPPHAEVLRRHREQMTDWNSAGRDG